ncbi:hypothetical protein EBS02_06325 [bacterium]|nr:hypothetical protein [bacterium]
MAVALVSPGILVREVDLTVGRADNFGVSSGAIAGPFQKGPVDYPITITNEQELLSVFGKPLSTDNQYEYWLSASSFLSYTGILRVVRTDGSSLNNANIGVGIANTTSVKIKNYDDYIQNWNTASNYYWAAKNPGKWANNLKVCYIDDYADQTIGITTTNPGSLGVVVGNGVTTNLTNIVIAGTGSTSLFNGYLKGIITGVSTDSTNGLSTFDVKVVSRVSSAGTETNVAYAEGGNYSFKTTKTVNFIQQNTGIVTTSSQTITSAEDWYNQQTLGLTNGTIYWKSLAEKPQTNQYVSDRSGRGDALHVVVVDDDGSVTGIKGNILEKNINLSKASDAVSSDNSPLKVYYKDYLATQSAYLFAGYSPSSGNDSFNNTFPVAIGFEDPATYGSFEISDGIWGQNAQGITFSVIGNKTYILNGGQDYVSSTGVSGGGFKARLSDLMTSYDLFKNKEDIDVDVLINGPGLDTKEDSQAKANYLISIAETRQDSIAVISPYRSAVVASNLNNTSGDTQTTNVVQFFQDVKSSSYTVFDSGYKYMYDRFNNAFRYIPCNADVAGLMVRTDLNQYPWFSPAGQQRGVFNNATKLAYNPNKAQRDALYIARVNPVILQPGIGVLLFGDKTGLSYNSAFDRINVRRLFLTLEKSLENAAKAQLFEFNDEVTRANFVNIVEPFLRDVQAKRGIYDFLVICDTTNNTPDVIDNNEFRADIYIKPAKSINFVSLTFVATRTGVSFSEVAGRA